MKNFQLDKIVKKTVCNFDQYGLKSSQRLYAETWLTELENILTTIKHLKEVFFKSDTSSAILLQVYENDM